MIRSSKGADNEMDLHYAKQDPSRLFIKQEGGICAVDFK